MTKLTTTLLLLLASTYALLGQAPKFSNEFLSIGVGAKAHGMSRAMVANVSDGTAAYWNPAGLSYLNTPLHLNAMHAEWFAGVAKYDYVSIIKPLQNEKNAVIGLSVIRLGIDNIPYTFNLVGADGSINYDNVTPFSAADYAGIFSYSQSIGDKGITLGGNTKVIYRNIGRFAKAYGFGIDLGIQYRKENWQFGATLRDATSTFNAWSFSFTEEEKTILELTDNEIPQSSIELTSPQMTLGAAYVKKAESGFQFLAEIDLITTFDGKRNTLIKSSIVSVEPALGLELGYKDFVFLRGGIGNIQKSINDIDGLSESYSMQPNIGAGFKIGRLAIDYAYTDIGNVSQSLYSHIFSLGFSFKNNSNKPARRNPVNPAPDQSKPRPESKFEDIKQID